MQEKTTMKKTIFFPVFLLALLLLSPFSGAGAIDYCDKVLAREITGAYEVQSIDEYRGYLRELLNHSHEALRAYVKANIEISIGEEDTGEGVDDTAAADTAAADTADTADTDTANTADTADTADTATTTATATAANTATVIPVPLSIAAGVLAAEVAEPETKTLLEALRAKYSPDPTLFLRGADFEALVLHVADDAIAAAWNECRMAACQAHVSGEHSDGKQNGIAYRIHKREDRVFAITFTYLPERENDPAAVLVTGLTVMDGTALTPTVIARQTRLHRYTGYTQTFRRDQSGEDVTIVLDLKGRVGVEIQVTNRPEDPLPLGTIVASMLGWEDYADLVGDYVDYDPEINRWAPCDGRDIAGSRLEEAADDTDAEGSFEKAPDLRGVFLRGLNQFDEYEHDYTESPVPPEREDPEGLREAGHFQEGNVGAHSHASRGGGAHGKTCVHHGYGRGKSCGLWHDGDHTQANKGGKTLNNPGGETRPKNVAVHYYMKIN